MSQPVKRASAVDRQHRNTHVAFEWSVRARASSRIARRRNIEQATIEALHGETMRHEAIASLAAIYA
jgi:hypothetical protein